MDLPDEFWKELYEDIPAQLELGEKTRSMIAADLHCDIKTAQKIIDEWVKKGRLVPVGERMVRGKKLPAWKPAAEKKET